MQPLECSSARPALDAEADGRLSGADGTIDDDKSVAAAAVDDDDGNMMRKRS